MREHRLLSIGLAILIGASPSALGQTAAFVIDGPKFATLGALIDYSSVIVEATVESAAVINQSIPISEFEIRVSRVLKGSLASNRITVQQVGGTAPGGQKFESSDYSLMVQGERYILFLQANSPVPHYTIAGAHTGLAKVEGGRIVWSKGMPEYWKKAYDLRGEELIATIVSWPGR